jgi:hypothetical protein
MAVGSIDYLMFQLGREISDRLHHYLQQQSSRSLYPESLVNQQKAAGVTALVPVRITLRRKHAHKPLRVLETMVSFYLTLQEHRMIAGYATSKTISRDQTICTLIELALQTHPVREEMSKRLRKRTKGKQILLEVSLWDTITWQEKQVVRERV